MVSVFDLAVVMTWHLDWMTAFTNSLWRSFVTDHADQVFQRNFVCAS